MEPGGPFEGFRVHCTGHSFGGAVAACLAGLLDGVIDVEALGNNDTSSGRVPGAKTKNSRRGARAAEGAAAKGGKQQRRAGVAGERGETFRDRRKASSSGESDESDGDGGGQEIGVDGAAPWVGICPGKVTCVTLGCPPCLSQNLRLPFVTSFVLGDDMVPRTSHESLRRLKRRLLQASGWAHTGNHAVILGFRARRVGGDEMTMGWGEELLSVSLKRFKAQCLRCDLRPGMYVTVYLPFHGGASIRVLTGGPLCASWRLLFPSPSCFVVLLR